MRLRPMRRAALLLCALSVAACGTGTLVSVPPTATPGPISYPLLPSAGTVSATIPQVGGAISSPYIYGIAADDTAVWVHNAERGTAIRVDPASNKVVATIAVGHGVGDVVLQAGFVWVGNHDDSTVSKIDPQTNMVVDTISVPPPTGFLGSSPGAVWVASKANGTVRKIDSQTDRVAATIFSAYGPSWSAFAAGSLWVCNHDAEAAGVTRVDPTSSTVLADINIAPGKGYSCDGIVASGDEVWVGLLNGDQTFDVGLVRVDPTIGKVSTVILLPQSQAASALAADAQDVWSARDVGLLRISATTHRAVGFLSVAGGVAGVAVGAGSVLALNGDGALLRITPAS